MADNNTEDVLRKADALIRRTRVFVAGSPKETAQIPPPEDDLPVLTDIVTEHDVTLAAAPPHIQQHLDALREELSRWLDQELPQAVLSVTDGLADQLTAELTHQAEKNLLPRLIACLDDTVDQFGGRKSES